MPGKVAARLSVDARHIQVEPVSSKEACCLDIDTKTTSVLAADWLNLTF